jgi:hydrogenase expression/formation protein HypD
MKFVDEYRDALLTAPAVAEITRLSVGRSLKLMEICGGHTHTIYKHGIEGLLPSTIDLVHGPGCPVCVLPMGQIDDAVAMAQMENVIFTTFGDMMRVPGSQGSLLDARAAGADVRFVYSPLDALKIARQNPDRKVIFFAIGFETTTPSTAVTLLRARAERIKNFFVFCNHICLIPALQALLDSPDLHLDGFVGPGHVSMVIGTKPYEFIAQEYQKPVVISGFEPLDIIQSVLMIVRQHHEGRVAVENQYTRVVRPEGNVKALEAIEQTMETRETFEWRGLGWIPASGLKLRAEFADWDAEQYFVVPRRRIADPKACQCGEVLRGVLKPWECGVFGTACTPETPIGTCMVSSEGACAAYYNYGRFALRSVLRRLDRLGDDAAE